MMATSRGHDGLSLVAARGWAVDEGGQEVGVRCVAVAVVGSPVSLALSISGPAPRMTAELVDRAVPLLQDVSAGLSADLG